MSTAGTALALMDRFAIRAADPTLMATGTRAIDTAVVQAPSPPADLTARGAQRQIACEID